jgi:phosphoserine phosphatase RsbX
MTDGLLEWHCACRPAPGESVSGDRALVAVDGPRALAAVIDGLGHGPAAAAAADAALEAVRTGAADDVVDVAMRCHVALRATRGAAIGLATIDTARGALSWLGIGNVEGRLVRGGAIRGGGASLLLAAGVVGHEIPRLRPVTLSLGRGDLLLVATDGVAGGFAEEPGTSGSCRALAERLLAEHARPTDDALVLAVRYLGVRR